MEILMQSENLRLGVEVNFYEQSKIKRKQNTQDQIKKERQVSYSELLSKSKYINKIKEHTLESEDETDISSKAMYNSINVIQ